MNKIIYILLTIITLSCISIKVNAEVTTRGARSCGEWVTNRENKGSSLSFSSENWVTGFLSGYAAYSNKDILKGTDNESIFLWVDNYCHKNPLEYTDSASGTLFKELLKQKGL
jgi:hypothetical protein